jgi:hypothetical protein
MIRKSTHLLVCNSMRYETTLVTDSTRLELV